MQVGVHSSTFTNVSVAALQGDHPVISFIGCAELLASSDGTLEVSRYTV